MPELNEGKKAPLFTLPDSTGKKIALKDLTGKQKALIVRETTNTVGRFLIKAYQTRIEAGDKKIVKSPFGIEKL